MRDRHTPTEEAIVLCHLGVPRLDVAHWSLAIAGLVARPLTLTFDDLLRYSKTEITSIHQCAGSPLQPLEPTRRICNLRWGGARLVHVLADCGPHASARYIWSHGADYGEFGGVSVEAYIKDLPIGRVHADVLIAYEMNGAPLPAEHGYPARLVVPGFYGTNSVKWLTRLEFAEGRAQGPFTTRWYNDPTFDESGRPNGGTTPVWSIAPESIIVSPALDEWIDHSAEREIFGWAWADEGIAGVDISTDDGKTWQAANIEPARDREWQGFSLAWKPHARGNVTLLARAVSNTGARQPLSGWRNAIHRVSVKVV
jgi:DMSO/TMAO reductase YedYZ molybdopterin-dependent catalytic subunit